MNTEEQVTLEYWAEKTKHKIERFVLINRGGGYVPSKMTMREWNDWFKDF